MKKTEDLEKAFIELVKNNERLIYKVCSFYVSENYTMEDLYQDVICNLWSGFGKFRNECSIFDLDVPRGAQYLHFGLEKT